MKHNMETRKKELYEAPAMDVVEVKAEGVICQSGGTQNYDWNSYFEE